jgi:hypothetical protein
MNGFYPPDHTSFEQLLDIALGEILETRSPYAYTTLTAIERYLKQFGLQDQWQVEEVLTTAYRQGKAHLHQGGTMHNPHAWLKWAAFEIIRERSQSQDADSVDLCPDNTALGPATPASAALELEQQLTALWKAIQGLAADQADTIGYLSRRVLDPSVLSALLSGWHPGEEPGPHDLPRRRRTILVKKHLRRAFHAYEQRR